MMRSLSANSKCEICIPIAYAVTGPGAWKITTEKSGCRWKNTPLNTSCLRTRTFLQNGVKLWGKTGNASKNKWLHTLGNLTLTGYNSEYSDRPFEEKRDMAGGFRESPLRLNAGLGAEVVWNEDAIKRRATKLSDLASKVWAYPKLEPDTLERYRPQVLQTATGYSLEDYSYLQNSEARELFEMLASRSPCTGFSCFRRNIEAIHRVPRPKPILWMWSHRPSASVFH